jgi:3-oxoacyl-[acyl-carrier-protein] synthase II
MAVFIKSASCISPQQTFGASALPVSEVSISSAKFQAIEPDYKTHLNIPSARRMSRLIKMSVCSALSCLKESGVQVPDAIIAGTGLGCMEDSEKFLQSLIVNNEQTLSPTSFIFSTHNTVAGQIALLLQCNNYNFTHTHRGLSFENTLMDAMLFLNDYPEAQVLAGASDEVTETSFKILQRLGAVKNNISGSDDLKQSSSPGTIAGEGSAFFLLNNSEENAVAKISALITFTNPPGEDEIFAQLEKFIGEHKLSAGDLILYGINGDTKSDQVYKSARQKFFKECRAGYFKHLCGEYHTSTAFATWMAAMILKNQSVPGYVLLDDHREMNEINKILIFNHYKGREFALILLEKC